MQATFFYHRRFLKKLADDQCYSKTKSSMYHINPMYIQLFTIVVDWPEIGCLKEVSTMFHICSYCVFTWGDRSTHTTSHPPSSPTQGTSMKGRVTWPYLIVLSDEPLTTSLSRYWRQAMPRRWPFSVRTNSQVPVFHTCTMWQQQNNHDSTDNWPLDWLAWWN